MQNVISIETNPLMIYQQSFLLDSGDDDKMWIYQRVSLLAKITKYVA